LSLFGSRIPVRSGDWIADFGSSQLLIIMDAVRGRDTVTLQTCTFPDLLNRLIVRADRV
jgi:hypothetical protein